MATTNPHYIIDRKRNRISVGIPVTEFETIMDKLEELEDIRLYDETKFDNESSISIDRAFEIMEAKREGS